MTITACAVWSGGMTMIATASWAMLTFRGDPYVGLNRRIKYVLAYSLLGALAGALAGWGWGVG